MTAVAAVILAAGLGRRFGKPKVTARLGDRTFLGRVVELARDAGLDPIIAVVPAGLQPRSGVRAVVNSHPDRGLSSSLQLGIAAVPPGTAALVLLVDQPTLARASIDAVLTARGTRAIVAAEAGGRLAPPALIEPEAFGVVATLSGDIGLREILRAHPERVWAARVPAHAPDVDTAADLAALEARLES